MKSTLDLILGIGFVSLFVWLALQSTKMEYKTYSVPTKCGLIEVKSYKTPIVTDSTIIIVTGFDSVDGSMMLDVTDTIKIQTNK